MTKNEVRNFLEDNKIEYEEIKEGQEYRFYLYGYKNIFHINCYYENCEIIVNDGHDIIHYDCNYYLGMGFLKDYK